MKSQHHAGLIALVFACIFSWTSSSANAQCEEGETTVEFVIGTDNWGYEIYWELTPAGNFCGGSSTIATGGNNAVGCSANNVGAGGYVDNVEITEGPWCLTTGEDYIIHSRDGYGDGGASYAVNVDGYPLYAFDADATNQSFEFSATPPPAVDAGIEHVDVPGFVYMGGTELSVEILNGGTTAIESLTIAFLLDDVFTGSQDLSGLNFDPFTTLEFTLSELWYPATTGTYNVKFWVYNVNGPGGDGFADNNYGSKDVVVIPSIPNILPSYWAALNSFDFELIAGGSDDVDDPMDLDFNPNGDLWVVNYGTESSGGSTVKITSPGEAGQNELWQQDGNAWHFMSLPSGLAFGSNGNFATSPAVYDANHDGGEPFTGPALWSSDPEIYAQPSGGNGSHLDMLHESPEALGIAFETENAYWVYDSYNQDVVRYHFQSDHGPGNSYHADGEILRYQGMGLEAINTEIACHLELDEASQWLYFVDGGNQRVLRLDINSGTIGGAPSWGPHESVAMYNKVVGYDWEEVVTTDLVEPAGIDILGNNMVVTDHSNGDIILYDISSMPAVELGRIETGEAGIMGVVIGPDGYIWYCNKPLNKVVRVNPSSVIIDVAEAMPSDLALSIYPNPTSSTLIVEHPNGVSLGSLQILDKDGRILQNLTVQGASKSIDVSGLAAGVYFLKYGDSTQGFLVD
jgi:hypothetical protein